MNDVRIPDGSCTNVTYLPNLAASIHAGLAQLLLAFDYAVESESDVWDFAVEISDLRAVGMTSSDLRWLVVKGLLQHGEETPVFEAVHRTFRAGHGLTFAQATSFVLTPAGAAVARNSIAGAASPLRIHGAAAQLRSEAVNVNSLISSDRYKAVVSSTVIQSANGDTRAVSPVTLHLLDDIKPIWESRRRELRVGDYLVKQFRVRAKNQELVLAAFQEESWPDFIDDPLPGKAGIVPKQRLQNVVHRLNCGQSLPLLRFCSNGNGNGLGWKLLPLERNVIEKQSKCD